MRLEAAGKGLGQELCSLMPHAADLWSPTHQGTHASPGMLVG